MIRSAEKNGERTDTMEKSDIRYQAYVSILEEELKPAMGCTEPIAIAYCAAVAREVLGGLPEKVKVGASGSMIKNVKSVIVPNTDHLKGIPAAAAAGIVAGDPKKELEVIASVTKEQITAMKEFLQTTPVEVEHIDNGITFDIIVTLTRGTDTSMVRIANYHTNVVHIEKNGEVIRDIPVNGEEDKDKKIDESVNLRSIAEDTAGFTGAELANILNESAIIATIKRHKAITNKDIEDAVKKVTVGLEKHSRVISEKDKKLTAFHEAGHAIVSRYLETQKEIKEVSIIPRGVAGGYTMYKTNEDKFYVSKQEMQEKLISLLGGRAAEKLALDDISTGASNDIEVATKIATDMVTIYGMSDIVGPISINTEKDPYQMELLGDRFEDSIGAEIKQLIDNAYYQAQKILSEHMDKLEQVATALMKQEIISAEEFESFFQDNQ